jgi:hypothetical protein
MNVREAQKLEEPISEFQDIFTMKISMDMEGHAEFTITSTPLTHVQSINPPADSTGQAG